MAKTNANAPSGPWRGGRPSFKAFYPEIVFLTVVTIAFIALGARLSCAEMKPKSEKAEPKPVSSATFFSTAQAFAQDASLDATQEVGDDLSGALFELPVSPIEEGQAAAPNAENAKKADASAKILAIWSVCLGIPAFLWIWRAWNWLVSVYGVRFEIRCDVDNPKATTFLVTRGILNKKTDSLHIAQVKDIQSSQTFFQKYFQGGVGTISLFTRDLTDGVLMMKNMEEPSRVFNALDELRRRYWALGGIGGINGQAENDVDAEQMNDAM